MAVASRCASRERHGSRESRDSGHREDPGTAVDEVQRAVEDLLYCLRQRAEATERPDGERRAPRITGHLDERSQSFLPTTSTAALVGQRHCGSPEERPC